MQKITVIGRLGRDAVVRETTQGERFLTMTVAASSKVRGAEKTTWYEVMSFNPRHQGNLMQYLKKGSAIVVVGDVDLSVQQGNDGRSYLRASIIADSLDFPTSNASGSTNTQEGTVQSTVTETTVQPVATTQPATEAAPTTRTRTASKPKQTEAVPEDIVMTNMTDMGGDGGLDIPF